jgi:protein-S-isoprenylcysteine O-methyltransferase Ste14
MNIEVKSCMYAISACWIALFSYWSFMAFRVKQETYQENAGRRLIHLSAIALCFALLYDFFYANDTLHIRLIPLSAYSLIGGVIICASGIAFAIWARTILGSNWSGRVTLKEGHELIKTGPYAIVRHPIYTGILFGMIGTAMTVGELRGFLAVIIALAAFTFKLKGEEKLMMGQFPNEYPAYKQRVKMIVPFLF